MTKYDLYTVFIGICSVFFSLAVFNGTLPFLAKVFFMTLGVLIFIQSAYALYRSLRDEKFTAYNLSQKNMSSNNIREISLLNKIGESVNSWELYGRTSAVIGKDIGENKVDIDLSDNPYASMIDVEHAVLNYAGGNWYIEDLGSQNGLSIKKIGQANAYKLSSLQPCKLDCGDIIFVGVCQLKLS